MGTVNSSIETWKLRDDELVKLKELPSLPPTGSDGQRLKPPFRIPQNKRKGGKRINER